jgi:hypothetical protein
MVTKLHGLLKREVSINGQAYVVSMDETGLKLTLKGRRLGQDLKWEDLASGDAALAQALNASLANSNDAPRTATTSTLSARRVATNKKRRTRS